MVEYTGQLIKGPDDGNIVTTSVDEIPIKNTLEMWLDGEGKDISVIVTYGKYVWNGSYFEWKLGAVDTETITPINE